jgi:hypothetical protein
MKAYGGVDVKIHIFLTSALVGDKWSASRLGRFTSGEIAPGTHWIEVGWTPEPVWTTWRRENSWPYRDSKSNPSVVQPVASLRYPGSQYSQRIILKYYLPLHLTYISFMITLTHVTVIIETMSLSNLRISGHWVSFRATGDARVARGRRLVLCGMWEYPTILKNYSFNAFLLF